MNDNFKGVWIPASVWECKELKLLEKHFLCQIKSLDNNKGCFASNSKFAKFFGLSNPRCTQVIKSLETKGFVKIQLFREGKRVVKRVINLLNKGSKLFKEPSKNTKEGVVNFLNDSNIKEKSNKESKEPPLKFLEEMKQTLNGEIIQRSALDKNFNFGLFPDDWSDNLRNEILRYFRYMEQKKGDRWGILGTVSSQLSVLKSHCNEYSEKEIIDSLQEVQLKGNVSYNPLWTKNRNKNNTQEIPITNFSLNDIKVNG